MGHQFDKTEEVNRHIFNVLSCFASPGGSRRHLPDKRTNIYNSYQKFQIHNWPELNMGLHAQSL